MAETENSPKEPGFIFGEELRWFIVSTFFKELERRKVYRVAVAYAVVAGGIIQLASAVFPAWELPSWALRLVVVLLLAGFPIALILAWAFDVTPAGIQATEEATPRPPGQTLLRRRRNLLLLGGLGIAVSLIAVFSPPRASARKLEIAIASSLSRISVTTRKRIFRRWHPGRYPDNLAKIGDLKVISPFGDAVSRQREECARNRKGARRLGDPRREASAIRKPGPYKCAADNAATTSTLAEDYDRDLTDVFAIQTDLAQNRSRARKQKLSRREGADDTQTHRNGEAYLAFVQAHNLHMNLEDFDKLTGRATLERALQMDPNSHSPRPIFTVGELDLS